MKAAILGTTGYTGLILLRLLAEHEDVDEVLPVSSSQNGELLESVDPGIGTSLRAKTQGFGGRLLTVEEMREMKPDVVFSALPHMTSAEVCGPFFGSSVVIDLSADFRIKNHALFQEAYKQPPPRADLLEHATYGLTEIYRKQIAGSDLIANPGCYPTASLLPLFPLARAGLIHGKIFINAMSGISGAGRKAQTNYLFCERDDNAGVYNPGKSHRHAAEMTEQISTAASNLNLYFTPHLVPMSRGEAATTTVELTREVDDAEIAALYETAYSDSPFVRITPGRLPQTKDVLGSNRCDISWHREDGVLFLFSVIDNLVKGASGQAVQNMNVRFGFP
ncbi:MAG TPA: N-acetyl-gamma-glutamyl-phosphate reductase, partial [Spirochaetia bacterium]|nr:N-acetyl-gamma-glutamyl-phosphate reductase [Spirochaetia bacterium]